MRGRMCIGWKTGVRIGKIWQKGHDQEAQTRESICEGVANCIGLNRGSKTINYNI